MEKYYFSPSDNAFYVDSEIHLYEAAGTKPDDLIEVSYDTFFQFAVDAAPVGKVRTSGIDGLPKWVNVAPPTSDEIESRKVAVIQAHLDAAAQAMRFDNILAAISYADEPAVPKFQAQGQALRQWRSLVWQKGYSILGAVNAGTRSIPADAELIAELPPLVLPE